MNFSNRTPRPVESWVPNRHQSVPTQVFTVRSPLAYAWPETMPAAFRSAHTAGRSSLRTPNRSIRWPPVTLTVGIANLSTTSAMARSSEAEVTPPHMRGTTE